MITSYDSTLLLRAAHGVQGVQPNPEDDDLFDIAIVGAGPAGLGAGLAAATLGLRTAVIGPPAGETDARTAALFQPSIAFLENIGVWPGLGDCAAALKAIRLVDATGALLRAPEVTFRASDIGLEAFGYNVPNARLVAELERAAAGRLTRIEAAADTIAPQPDRILITTSSNARIAARLAGAADGRNSATRAAAGVTTDQSDYDQAAIVASFAHSRPHRGVSTEFHRRSGPLTLVPGLGDVSHLVWVEAPDEARRLAALSDDAFADATREVIDGLLGDVKEFTPRRTFPLIRQRASALAQNRVALIGEAAHVMAPIGAQGLNVSLRDAATLATLAAEAKRDGRDPGADAVLADYARARRLDVASRDIGIELLNRALLWSWLPPVHFTRGFGLFALSAFPALGRAAMRAGIAPPELPAIMHRRCSDRAVAIDAALDDRSGRRA